MVDMNISETLVSYETAKLAKEVGFDIPCGQFYDSEDSNCDQLEEPNSDGIFLQQRRSFGMYEIIIENYNNLIDLNGLPLDLPQCASAPTQSLLQKWLRERHDIDVWASPYWITSMGKTTKGYETDIVAKKEGRSKRSVGFNTYEEALEAGLLEALKLIKT